MSTSRVIGILAALVGTQILVLFLFGQPLVSRTGYLGLWEGNVRGIENSQQLTDWYTFSHIIHGIIFYWLLTYFFPRLSFRIKLFLAVGIEIGWELLENTPMLIEHYRQQALAQGYFGDSILNSVSDTFAAMVGFFAAARLPILASIALVIGLELFVAYAIHDNLTLNVLGLFYQFDLISDWQLGG